MLIASLLAKPGDRRKSVHCNPFRVKRRMVMRASRVVVLVFVLVAAASAADLKVKVVDPQSAAVAGAQVTLFVTATEITMIRSDNVSTEGVVTTFSKIATTSAEGVATFTGVPSTSDAVQLQVLAPGFAPYKETGPGRPKELITVQLRVATASETVVVSATRTPVVGEAAGADVETLTSGELDTAQPVAANDPVRFLPGAIVNTAGQRGGLSSLFVRGGESRYNKVIVDGVTVNEPGGTFDFGTLRLTEANRVEFVRGAQSTLYGSDAMTSVVQVWTREGSTPQPELRFGADGGNFGTANGYASLAGTHGLFDYNVFGDQFNTSGFGVNNTNSDSLEGANVGAALSGKVSLRVHLRHFNNHTGLPGEWNFNGVEFVPPIPVGAAQLNNLLGSTEIAIAAPSGWQHRFTAFDYLYRYNDYSPGGNVYNFPSHEADHINRVGFEYQGDYSERTTARFMAHTTFGYRVENENGYVGDVDFGQTHGQRLNNDFYVQQQLSCEIGRASC